MDNFYYFFTYAAFVSGIAIYSIGVATIIGWLIGRSKGILWGLLVGFVSFWVVFIAWRWIFEEVVLFLLNIVPFDKVPLFLTGAGIIMMLFPVIFNICQKAMAKKGGYQAS